jgi:hypothetical protein
VKSILISRQRNERFSVAGRQRPNRVDMIGQHHHGVDRKRVARLRQPRRLAQRADIVRQKAASPVQQIDGEEPAYAGREGTAIIRHGGNDRLVLTQVARRSGDFDSAASASRGFRTGAPLRAAGQCAPLIAPYGLWCGDATAVVCGRAQFFEHLLSNSNALPCPTWRYNPLFLALTTFAR